MRVHIGAGADGLFCHYFSGLHCASSHMAKYQIPVCYYPQDFPLVTAYRYSPYIVLFHLLRYYFCGSRGIHAAYSRRHKILYKHFFYFLSLKKQHMIIHILPVRNIYYSSVFLSGRVPEAWEKQQQYSEKFQSS